MLQRLSEMILSIRIDLPIRFVWFSFLLNIVLTIFILTSRRMNMRTEAAFPTPILLRMSRSLLYREHATLTSLGIARIATNIHHVAYRTLKLFPDKSTGRRLNVLPMLLASWCIANSLQWFNSSSIGQLFNNAYRGTSQTWQAQGELWKGLVLTFLSGFLFIVPFLLIRRNREFYFDVVALFMLLNQALIKLIICWNAGCCYGIPFSWGAYSERIEAIVFPVQLLEFACGALLSVLCIVFMLFGKHYQPGRGCSFCLLSFAVTRFFSEFLRYHDDEYRYTVTSGIAGMTMIQVMCIVAAAVAIAWLFLLPIEKKLMDRFWTYVERKQAGKRAIVPTEENLV